jgi:hypothetical protein
MTGCALARAFVAYFETLCHGVGRVCACVSDHTFVYAVHMCVCTFSSFSRCRVK